MSDPKNLVVYFYDMMENGMTYKYAHLAYINTTHWGPAMHTFASN